MGNSRWEYNQSTTTAPSDDREALRRVAYEAFCKAHPHMRTIWTEEGAAYRDWWCNAALAVAAAVRKREGQGAEGLLDAIYNRIEATRYTLICDDDYKRGRNHGLIDAQTIVNEARSSPIAAGEPEPAEGGTADRGEEARERFKIAVVYYSEELCWDVQRDNGLWLKGDGEWGIRAYAKSFPARLAAEAAANQAAIKLAEVSRSEGKGEVKG